MKKIVKYVLVFLGLLLVFCSLLFVGSLFPSNVIEQHSRESAKTLIHQGNLYKFFPWFDVVNNNYTDALMINEAYSVDSEAPLYSAMAVRRDYKAGVTKFSRTDMTGESLSMGNYEFYDAVGELFDFMNGNVDTSVAYARYWHGYLPFLRVGLIFFNITGIRLVLLVIFIVLFVWLLKLIKDKLSFADAIIFALSFVFYSYFLVSYSLESAPIFLVMMISSIVLLKRIDRIKNLYLFVFIVACIANFVDYLTVPLITLAIPLILYILYKQKCDSDMDCIDFIKIVVKASVIWFVGYGLTWVSKWIIYDVLYGEGIIKSAVTQVVYRAGATDSPQKKSIFEVIGGFILQILLYCAVVGGSIGIFLFLNRKKYVVTVCEKKVYFEKTLPILLVLLMPIAWYVVLSNHTIVHTRFTFRHMLIFSICFMIACKNIFVVNRKRFKELKEGTSDVL